MSTSLYRQTSTWLPYFAFLLAVSSVKTNKGSVRHPVVKYEVTVLHGHFHVAWDVDKNFARTHLPIKYNVNFCPKKLNHGVFRCNVSKVICGAVYNGRTYTGSIQQHPENITNYLTQSDYEELNNTIELPGPLIEGGWDQSRRRFSCGIFMHHCMDGQMNPWFVYQLNYNGTTTDELGGPINLSVGAPVKSENVTIEEPVQHGCCSYRVVIKWQIIHVCRVDVPSYKIWITNKNKTIAQNHIYNGGRKVYSFKTTFRDLPPGSSFYTVHIEGYKQMLDFEDLNASYTKKLFRTPGIRSTIKLNTVAIGGYISFSWTMNHSYLINYQDIVYNISWCPRSSNKKSPWTCNISTTLCKATYNGSSAHGQIEHYSSELMKYKDYRTMLNATSHNLRTLVNSEWDSDKKQSLVNGEWDSDKKQFVCKLFFNPCRLDNYRFVVKYESYFDGQYLEDYENSEFKYGFISEPNISTHTSFTGKNTMSLTVNWSYDRVCDRGPSTTSIIWITTINNEKNNYKKDQGRGNLKGHEIIEYKSEFLDLPSFTTYTIHIKGNHGNEVIKHFTTPEGVPTGSPVLDQNPDNNDDCVDRKRNYSIQWKPPPKNVRNGIIRNNQILYWIKSQIEMKRNLINLDNRTSYVLIDLDCDEEYNIQVRACLQQNDRCSDYSDILYLPSVPAKAGLSKTKDFSDVFLWASIGIAVILIIIASYVCQCLYRKRTRVQLEPFGEADVNGGYCPPDNHELTNPGQYCFLVNSEEDVYTVP